MLKRFYIIAAIIGTFVPWYFFATFFMAEGFNIPLFVQSLFTNGACLLYTSDAADECPAV